MTRLGVSSSRRALGLAWVRRLLLLLLLLPGVGRGAVLTVVALALLAVASRALLSVG